MTGGRAVDMSNAASLSSVATALAELTARVTAIADDLSGSAREDVAGLEKVLEDLS